MIVVYHNTKKVIKIFDVNRNAEIEFSEASIQQVIITISKTNKNAFIGWCYEQLSPYLNLENAKSFLKNSLVMTSFETSKRFYIDSSIGFVESSPFLKVNKSSVYPTWLMSSNVGFAHAKVFLQVEKLLKLKISFDLFLNAVSKSGINKGLLCYSNPNLLTNFPVIKRNKIASQVEILQFIKSFYKKRWLLLYFLNQLIFNRKLVIISFFKLIFKSNLKIASDYSDLIPQSSEAKNETEVDVIIPTLGRKHYLKKVLDCFAKQTLLPRRIILVEQDPTGKNKSELNYIKNSWPFKIEHIVINKLGACNARNVALEKVTSNWVFFADDDIEFSANLLSKAFENINKYRANAATISCLQRGETESIKEVMQWSSFGTNASFVKSEVAKKCKFGMEYEFGYGEDADFGMQLRNLGVDVLYIPFAKMIHLKAPVGGFRNKINRDWDFDKNYPKPSPTIMVFKLKHTIREQFLGYKLMLFLKYFKHQKVKNPFAYYNKMQKAWKSSKYWANKLIESNNYEV